MKKTIQEEDETIKEKERKAANEDLN